MNQPKTLLWHGIEFIVIVVKALGKDGWNVNKDPLYVRYSPNLPAYEVDLRAEKLIAAEKNNRRIAVEIKEFAGSLGNQFHTALGQFLNYEAAIAENSYENDRHYTCPFLMRLMKESLMFPSLFDVFKNMD